MDSITTRIRPAAEQVAPLVSKTKPWMNLRKLIGVAALTVPVILGAATAASAEPLSVGAAQSQLATCAATSPKIGYDITIHTANVPYAGTDGNVWLRVNGTICSTKYMYLDDSANNYERNRTDHFLRSAPNVGRITSVTICFDPLGGANAEWLPDRVTVNGVVFWNTRWFLKGSLTCRTLWP